MKGRDIAGEIREAGYSLSLSQDWKRVRCAGPKQPTEAIRQLIKANREEIRCWLIAEAFRDHLNGRIISPEEAGVAVRVNYPAPDRNLQDEWLSSAEAIIRQRDEKGRLDATLSEIESCIIGIRSDPREKAKTLLQRLEDSIPEAKKCSSRLRAKHKRRQRDKE